MARTDFDGAITAILGGGACYWLYIIRPNTTDTWNPKAFGMLVDYDLTGYDVLIGRLLSAGDIDNKIDFYDTPMALQPDVEIDIQNVDGDIDPSIFQGRTLEIRFGYGDEMSIATSVIMFSGKIQKPEVELHKIKLKASGKGDKEVGVILPDNVDDKYKGRIYPLTWGDWTDENAFAPVVLNRMMDKNPDVVFDLQAWFSFQDLQVYDEESKTAYRAKITSGVVVGADNNLLSVVQNTGDELRFDITDLETEIYTNGVGLLAAYAASLDYGGKPVVIRMEYELILVVTAVEGTGAYAGNTIAQVERGYMGTTRAAHSYSPILPIYLIEEDLAKQYILCSHIFWCNSISGMRNVLYPAGTPATKKMFVEFPKNGSFDDLIDDNPQTTAPEFEGIISAGNVTTTREYTPNFASASKMNIFFQRVGIQGAVEHAYMILRAFLSLTYYDNIVGQFGGAIGDYYWVVITNSSGMWFPVGLTANGSTYDIIAQPGVMKIGPGSDAGWLLVRRTAGSGGPSASKNTPGALIHIMPFCQFNFTSWDKVCAETSLYIFKNSDTVYQQIGQITLDDTNSSSSIEVDNIVDMVNDEEDFEITVSSGYPAGDLKIENIEDLNDANFALQAGINVTPFCTAVAGLILYRFGMRMDFRVSPIKFDFWVKGKGRKNPGLYTGTLGELEENPASVIEDFIDCADNGAAMTEIEPNSFISVYSARSSWKLAHTIYAKDTDRPKFRDELKTILSCSGLVSFERFDGTLALATLDDPGAVTRFITDSDLKMDSNRVAQVSYSYFSTDMLITSIEIKYKPILPEDGVFASTVYCRHKTPQVLGGMSRQRGLPTNFSTEGGQYCYYLQQAYETLGEERPLVIEASCIRDAATAEKLAKLIIKLRYKPLVQVTIQGSYDLLNIELTDKIGLDVNLLPAVLNNKKYIVTGHRIQPHVNKTPPEVRIVLTELSTATVTAPNRWIVVGGASSNRKTMADGGRLIVQV